MILSSTWTVSDLLEALAEHDPDAEVRIAHQPGWPLQHRFHGAVSQHDLEEGDDSPEGNIVWLVASDEHPADGPYAPSSLWQQ